MVHYALMEELFPKHPNGQQTTLGKSEHLKNPSMKAIHQYFNDFYVPNNMAMVLVGDLEFDETILLVDKYFGELKYKDLPKKRADCRRTFDSKLLKKQLKVLLQSVCIWLGEQILTERRKRDWLVWWLKFCLILAKQVCWI